MKIISAILAFALAFALLAQSNAQQVDAKATCSSVPATPTQCYVNGQYVGGRECMYTTDKQYLFGIQNPGRACTSGTCGVNQRCATMGPIGSPTYCYAIAPASCTTSPGGRKAMA